MDPIMTRTRTGSLPGQVTSAALDGDLRDGGQSGTHPRGDEVLYSGRTSPNYLSDESTPETEDSLANCGDSDNPGRIQLSGGAGSKFQRKLEPVQIKTFTQGAISRGLQNVWPDYMHLRLRLAGLLNHDCSSMRATRATRASLMARQFNLIRLKPFHVAKMRMLTVPMF